MLPVIELLRYQQRWINDNSQTKIYTKSRQIGITFAETFSIVTRLAHRKDRWYYLSISEDRAADAMGYARAHCDALGILTQSSAGEDDFDGIRCKYLKITFANGSEMIGLPANPRTARGCSGNITLDEFAHHNDSDLIWTAVNPIISLGYRLHVLSSPNGQQGRMWRIWSSSGSFDEVEILDSVRGDQDIVGDIWSRHATTIDDAIKDGHPVDRALCRELAGDDETFAQEYLCRYLDEAHAWLPYSLIETAQSSDASLSSNAGGILYGGFDVGRKRDLSVLWIVELVGDRFVTRTVLPLRQSEYAQQQRIIDDYMPSLTRLCIDSGGIGAQLAEDTARKWGSLVEGVNFTNEIKSKLASKIKRAFEDCKIAIPDDEAVRRDLHSVRKQYTTAGNVRYDAPRTKDGHADRFWALALALHAADSPVPAVTGYERVDALRDWGDDSVRDWGRW